MTKPVRMLLFILVAVAVTWPFLDIGPRGPTILVITHEHGVDLVDLAALVPLTLALAIAVARRPA